MPKLHPVSSDGDDLVLLEHAARDIIAAAKAMEALMPLHQGGVIVGLKPALYRETLEELIAMARSKI